jgi:hypothetical protein
MRQRRIVAGALVVVAAVFASSGCSKSRPPAEPSGYLGDYSGFEPHPRRPGALLYTRPGLDLGRYKRVIVEPFEVALSPEVSEQSIDPEDLEQLSKYMYDAIVIVLRDVYPVVTEPGLEVLRLRVAITELVPTKPVLNTAETVLGGRLASSASRAITGTDLFVGEVAIEAEALDSVTGEREMALVERKFGKRFALEDGATTWGNVEKAFREWAVHFRLTMDRAHR